MHTVKLLDEMTDLSKGAHKKKNKEEELMGTFDQQNRMKSAAK